MILRWNKMSHWNHLVEVGGQPHIGERLRQCLRPHPAYPALVNDLLDELQGLLRCPSNSQDLDELRTGSMPEANVEPPKRAPHDLVVGGVKELKSPHQVIGGPLSAGVSLSACLDPSPLSGR